MTPLLSYFGHHPAAEALAEAQGLTKAMLSSMPDQHPGRRGISLIFWMIRFIDNECMDSYPSSSNKINKEFFLYIFIPIMLQ
jgi:hypothetical protein